MRLKFLIMSTHGDGIKHAFAVLKVSGNENVVISFMVMSLFLSFLIS